jgi:carbon-monoxide dehydrogenase small subunit
MGRVPEDRALMRITCTVNGRPQVAEDVWEGESLLYVLRERMGLPGSKNACEQGECGSCSVYLDGTLVCACLVLGGQAEGREILTVEGIGSADLLHPVQAAFVEAGAVQCGFCIREALAGNICRCTGYAKIIDAVHLAAGRMAAR